MKTFVKLLTLLVLFSMIVSCGAKPTEVPADGQLSAEEQWFKDNQLGPYFTLDQDWAAIEAAAKLEGMVTVYAGTSRIEDQIAIWNTVYPEITLDGYDTDDIAIKMTAEHDAGNVIGDVFFDGDMMSLYSELYPNNIVLPFVPSEFADTVALSDVGGFAIQRYGGDVWTYNNVLNPDGCPITNWWQIVDPALFSKSIFYEDPLSESDKISMLVTVIKHADDMAAAYQDQYGAEWTTDAMVDDTTPDAGWLWVKKFAKSNLVYIDGGDVITDAIGNLTMTEDAGIGNNSFSKLRDTIDGAANQWYCEGLKPAIGTSAPTPIGIAAFAPHPNAAKLYIRFSLTEQGAAPWWGVMGDFPSRSDVPSAEGAPNFGDVVLWPDDAQLMYEIGSQVRDFWTINLAP